MVLIVNVRGVQVETQMQNNGKEPAARLWYSKRQAQKLGKASIRKFQMTKIYYILTKILMTNS